MIIDQHTNMAFRHDSDTRAPVPLFEIGIQSGKALGSGFLVTSVPLI
ncbi:MAG: hypothetical protein P0107_01800 [Nitrosomonas sp.]|nr:hypothetical protein [Nitrosomonas sp.]